MSEWDRVVGGLVLGRLGGRQWRGGPGGHVCRTYRCVTSYGAVLARYPSGGATRRDARDIPWWVVWFIFFGFCLCLAAHLDFVTLLNVRSSV